MYRLGRGELNSLEKLSILSDLFALTRNGSIPTASFLQNLSEFRQVLSFYLTKHLVHRFEGLLSLYLGEDRADFGTNSGSILLAKLPFFSALHTMDFTENFMSSPQSPFFH
jgi:hypothetical protein